MPDIVTQEGLLAVIGVGCVLEFASVLNRDRYAGHYDDNSEEAIAMNVEATHARTRFRVIMKTFAARYVTIIGQRIVHPSYVWSRVLVQFGAALVTYMQQNKKVAVRSPGVTIAAVTAAVHLQTDHPHLVAPFIKELKLKPTTLTWNGPAIEVVCRNAQFDNMMTAAGLEEARELPEQPLYVGGDDSYYQGDWSSGSEDDEDDE